MPLGYPTGRFGPTDRIPSADVSSQNRFGGNNLHLTAFSGQTSATWNKDIPPIFNVLCSQGFRRNHVQGRPA